jgi:tetratricopeptide (TPR) repeat protein
MSQFIAEKLGLLSILEYITYIVAFFFFLGVFFLSRKIWRLYLVPFWRSGFGAYDSKSIQLDERSVRKNIKKVLSRDDYKTAAELSVSINELKDAAKFYLKAGLPVKAAELYEQMGNLEKAALLYKDAKNFTKSAENFEKLRDFRNAAYMYDQGGFYKKAAEFYKKINEHLKAAELYEHCFIEEGPRRAGSRKNEGYAYISGTLYEKAGNFDKAVSIYLRDGYFKEAGFVYEKQKEFIKAAEAYIQAGDLEKAAEALEQGGDEKRRNEVLCSISYQKGLLKEAADFAEKSEDLVRSAEILSEAQEFARAGDQYVKAGWYSEAGEMFMKVNELQKAAEAFEKGGKFVWAAQAFEKTGDKSAKIAELYEQGGEFFKAGSYYKELGLFDKAVNALQKLDETSDYYWPASIMIGELFMNKGMMKLAIERFQKIIANKPVSQSILLPYYYLGLCYEESGKNDMAKAIYDKILAVDYQFKDVHERSGKITTILSEASASGQRAHDLSKDGNTIPAKDTKKKRYMLMQEIGRGGMGIVYKAKDTLLNRVVAYKILPSFLSVNPSNFERFLREARISANLNHRNIVMIFDTGTEDNDNYITMEFIEGKALDTYLHEGRKFKNSEVVNIAKQTCRALAYAHKNNVVHRDIKPANIIINKEGVIKIMDFGIAKVLEDISKDLTSVSGTPLYMSPEQILGKDVDFQTDLYSFGATLFELVTGRSPFVNGDIYYQHLHTKPVSPNKIDPSIPDDLCTIILKCLEKDKAHRYKKAEEILADLDKLSM